MNHTKKIGELKLLRKFLLGFTLVELIVVITILAILGAIGFISIGGYSSRARDSDRVGDTANISKSLDISIITAGSYPSPDNAFAVTYSWGVVWNQGTVGSSVVNYLKSTVMGGGINQKPTDPLKNSEYVYSSLAEGKAYQIKAEYEGDISASLERNLLIASAYAASGDPTIAYIRGNYNGLTAKTTTGGLVYVLAVPSIVTNSGVLTGSALSIASLSGTLLFHGKALLNPNSFNPSVVVYSGGTLPANDTDITNMVTALQNVYSGANIGSNQNITTLLNTTGSTALISYGATIVKTQLGGSTVISSSSASVGCTAATWSGITIASLGHGASATYGTPITNGTGNVTASCSNGTLSYGSVSTACDSNYVASGIWACALDSCTGAAPPNSQVNGPQGTAAWGYSTTEGVCKFQCQAGYYWNGSNACVAASAGFAVASAGLEAQTPCAIGTYQDLTAQTSCKPVTAGYWASPNNGGTTNTAQTQCVAGTYCVGGVQSTTDAGYYTNVVGATSQTVCSAGSYCAAGSTSATQTICPANSYCPQASGNPTACGGSLVSPVGSTSVAACASPQKNPSGLMLTHTPNHREFVVDWIAGSGNGGAGGCKIQYYLGTTWTDIQTYNCDASSHPQVWLPSGGLIGAWSDVPVRLVRVSDGSFLGEFPIHLKCSGITGSASSTPLVDEDCNGSWDNTTGGDPYTYDTGNRCSASQTIDLVPFSAYNCTNTKPANCNGFSVGGFSQAIFYSTATVSYYSNLWAWRTCTGNFQSATANQLVAFTSSSTVSGTIPASQANSNCVDAQFNFFQYSNFGMTWKKIDCLWYEQHVAYTSIYYN